jgi:hypothetical protein
MAISVKYLVATQIENTRASVRKSFKKSTGALKVLAPYLKIKLQTKLVLIVTGTVTDVPQTSPHLVSGVIILYVIDNTALLQ